MSTITRHFLRQLLCASAAFAALPASAEVLAVHAGIAAPPSAVRSSAPALPQHIPAPVCNLPSDFARLNYPLVHTARRIASGEPLKIVAIGSSSTAGAGASSPAMNYPSRLAVELKERLPAIATTVLNQGVNGEETNDMVARFVTDVDAEHPDLVLWQVGTNSVLRGYPLSRHAALLHEGIARLKSIGADVVLIDMQYAPQVITKPATDAMEDQIALAAKEDSVNLFRRFALMRNWREVQHAAFNQFVAPDNLHMNDWSYGCIAKLLATGIVEAATRPTTSAAAPRSPH
jgi:lysophospholipase L1-like esterase